MSAENSSPEAVVQRQLEAYNAREIDALVEIYAEDVELFEHPSKLICRGSVELRTRFAARFSEPNLHASLRHRIVMGNIVIDHEEVTRTYPEGTGKVELLMIYEVQGARIAKAWMLAGAKRLDSKL